jgi:peptidoglycan L-alanyl-D-glutamate endopeptidase CwlK
MASRELIDLTPELATAYRNALRDWVALHPDGPFPFPTCTHRSDEEQEVLYMRDKNHLDDDGDGLIDEHDEWRSNAKPGQSGHNKYPAEAIDIAFRKKTGGLDWSEKLFADFAVLMKLYGAKWGGDWVKLGKSKKNDTPHYYM